jgi:hypothetical protein
VREAIRVTRHILGRPALPAFDGGEISPGSEVQSDHRILESGHARQAASTTHAGSAPARHRGRGLSNRTGSPVFGPRTRYLVRVATR